MNVHNCWYEETASTINSYQISLGKKDRKKYKLDLLLGLTRRVADFSPECGECQLFQQEITTIVKELGNLAYLPKQASKQAHKRYFKTISQITKHLQKKHKLVTEKQHFGIWIGIGMAIGGALGTALKNPGIGTALGIALGLAIGSYLDRKAREEGRVI